MIDTRTVGQELQGLQHQIVGRIRKGQETVAGAIKTWARNAQKMTPQIPALPSSEEFTSRLPSPEAFTSRLPKPEALVSGAYDIAEQLLAAQRKLSEQVTHAAKPLVRQGAAMFGPGFAQSAKSTARTSHKTAQAKPATATPKSSTTKSTTKNSTAGSGTAKSSTAGSGTAKSSTAGSGRKPAQGKPATQAKSATASAKSRTTAANGTAAKKARSAEK